MKGVRILILAIAVLTGALAPRSDFPTRRIEVRNRTDATVYSVYFARNKGAWGQDRLRAETMRPEEKKVLPFMDEDAGSCRFDIKAVSENGAVSLGMVDACDHDVSLDIMKGVIVAGP